MNKLSKYFVPYNRAKKLETLGFDADCFSWYVSEQYGLEIGLVKNKDLIRDAVLAPTFSQAFDWFREKYSLETSIVFQEFYLYEGNTNVYESIIEQRGGEIYIFTPINGFSTYEEAELACLDKLIEIAENYERTS